jgi:hypothetical protein
MLDPNKCYSRKEISVFLDFSERKLYTILKAQSIGQPRKLLRPRDIRQLLTWLGIPFAPPQINKNNTYSKLPDLPTCKPGRFVFGLAVSGFAEDCRRLPIKCDGGDGRFVEEKRKIMNTRFALLFTLLSCLLQACNGQSTNVKQGSDQQASSEALTKDSSFIPYVDTIPLRLQEYEVRWRAVHSWPRKRIYDDLELELQGEDLSYRHRKSTEADGTYKVVSYEEYAHGVVTKGEYCDGAIKCSEIRYYDTITHKLIKTVDLLSAAPFRHHKPIFIGGQDVEGLSEFDSVQASIEKIREYYLNIITKPDENGNVLVIYQLETVGDRGSTIESKYIFELYDRLGSKKSRSKIIKLKNEFTSESAIYFRPKLNLLVIRKGKGFFDILERNDNTKICLYTLDKGILVHEFWGKGATLMVDEFMSDQTFLIAENGTNKKYVIDIRERWVKTFTTPIFKDTKNLNTIPYETVEYY